MANSFGCRWRFWLRHLLRNEYYRRRPLRTWMWFCRRTLACLWFQELRELGTLCREQDIRIYQADGHQGFIRWSRCWHLGDIRYWWSSYIYWLYRKLNFQIYQFGQSRIGLAWNRLCRLGIFNWRCLYWILRFSLGESSRMRKSDWAGHLRWSIILICWIS